MPDKRLEELQRQIAADCEKIGRPIRIMEVCGTHTVALFRYGIRSMLPSSLKMLSGPGCPVCVTEQTYIDQLIQIAQIPDVIVATYGDMVRVPGSNGSLEKLHLPTVKVVYSIDAALSLAREYPHKRVVFAAVGFETTTPPTAVAIRQAKENSINNFFILCGHKRVVPAMEALLMMPDAKIDAFLCPGHVSVIIGWRAYEPIVRRFGKPCVVAGFEPYQILSGIATICRQIASGTYAVCSVYSAAVAPEGNLIAQRLIGSFFEPADLPWRGLGIVPQASFVLKPEYAHFDAAIQFDLKLFSAPEPKGCVCGKVLCGLLEPPECSLFGRACTPDSPVGPCMVSSEGACAAFYKYGTK